MSESLLSNLLGFLFSFSILIIAMVVHEFAHGWTAYKLGDNTAKYSGRLTLNPLAHIDPFATILLPLLLFVSTGGRFVFGAAKPVPIDYRSLKNPKRDIIWIGASGPLANLLLAFAATLLWKHFMFSGITGLVLKNLIVINIILAVFNLVPIPPLDGSRIVMGLLPYEMASSYASIEPYGMFIVIILISLGLFNALIWPVVSFLFGLMLRFPA